MKVCEPLACSPALAIVFAGTYTHRLFYALEINLRIQRESIYDCISLAVLLSGKLSQKQDLPCVHERASHVSEGSTSLDNCCLALADNHHHLMTNIHLLGVLAF